jgi:hypothetical protein
VSELFLTLQDSAAFRGVLLMERHEHEVERRRHGPCTGAGAGNLFHIQLTLDTLLNIYVYVTM